MTTRMAGAVVACAVVVLGLAAAAQAQVPTVRETWPENGADDVDAAAAEVRVVFSHDMEASFSFDKGKGEFPEVNGQPRWTGARTIVLPVKLKPETAYEILINSENYRNFRSTGGVPAEPVVWTFTTRALVRKAFRALPEEERLKRNAEAWEDLDRAVQTRYAHRDLKRIDWSARGVTYGKKARATADAGQWVDAVVEMLKVTRDPNVRLEVDGKVIPVYVPAVDRTWNDKKIARSFETYKDVNPVVSVGRKLNGVGYVGVKSIDADRARDLTAFEAAMKDLADAKFLIVDLRQCSGGSAEIAAGIAGWFTDQPRPYGKVTIRDIKAPGGWTPIEDLTFQPAGEGRHFAGPVCVLSSRKLTSAAEQLIMMLKECPNVTVVGDTTYGACGGERPIELPNGVIVWFPAVKGMLLDGTCYEAIGVSPDVYVNPTDVKAAFETADPVLERALKISQQYIWP